MKRTRPMPQFLVLLMIVALLPILPAPSAAQDRAIYEDDIIRFDYPAGWTDFVTDACEENPDCVLVIDNASTPGVAISLWRYSLEQPMTEDDLNYAISELSGVPIEQIESFTVDDHIALGVTGSNPDVAEYTVFILGDQYLVKFWLFASSVELLEDTEPALESLLTSVQFLSPEPPTSLFEDLGVSLSYDDAWMDVTADIAGSAGQQDFMALAHADLEETLVMILREELPNLMTEDEFHDYWVGQLVEWGSDPDQIEYIVVGGQPAVKSYYDGTPDENRFNREVSVMWGSHLIYIVLSSPSIEVLEQASPDFDRLIDSISFSSDEALTFTGDTVTLEDSGISITYPANWIGDDDITDQVCAAMPASVDCLLVLQHPAGDGSNIILYRYPLDQPMTAEQFLTSMEDSVSGMQVGSQERVEIDGHPAFRVGFHERGSYHVQWHILDGEHDLILEFFAPTQALSDQHVADVEAIIATLRFNPE